MASGTTLGISLAMGLSLAAMAMFIGWAAVQYGLSETMLKWALLPTLGYAIGIGLNLLVQQVSCGKVNYKQIAVGTTAIPLAILLFLLLSSAGIVRAPVVDAVPLAYKLQYGASFAVAFYMFWAGMFGEAISGGFAQSCAA
jgi:hypothetical protein